MYHSRSSGTEVVYDLENFYRRYYPRMTDRVVFLSAGGAYWLSVATPA